MPAPPRILGPVRWLARRCHEIGDRLRDRRREHIGVPRLLCLGDSNTWGYVAGTGMRLPRRARWPGIVEDRLGGRIAVHEAGRKGRVAAGGPSENDGFRFLEGWLRRHRPPDFAVIMLGSNDCLPPLQRPAAETAANLESLADLLLELPQVTARPGRLALVAPVPIVPVPGLDAGRAASLSLLLAGELHRVATRRECHFIDAGTLATAPPEDGVHLGREAHRQLGGVVADWISALLGADKHPAPRARVEPGADPAGR